MERQTGRVIAIGHPPSGGALINMHIIPVVKMRSFSQPKMDWDFKTWNLKINVDTCIDKATHSHDKHTALKSS